MRPVFSTEDQLEFHAAWERLEAGGIPVMEPSNHSDLSGYRVGPRFRTICIWLDEHYDDAIKLLQDPSHIVANPVNPEEFDRLAAQADAEQEKTLDRTHEKIINWLVGIGAAGAIAFGLYRVIGAL
jgi:hypothetical protein